MAHIDPVPDDTAKRAPENINLLFDLDQKDTDTIPDLTWYIFESYRDSKARIKSHTVAGNRWAVEKQAEPRAYGYELYCDPSDIAALRNDARANGLRIAEAPSCQSCKKPVDLFYWGSPFCLPHHPEHMGNFHDDDPHYYLDPDDDAGHLLLDV